MTSEQIAVYHPYVWYASATWCQPNTTLTWTCGENCNENPTFRPLASGGDGIEVQMWFVGYDPTLQTVIVAHQGTNVVTILGDLADADVPQLPLNPLLFPGVSPLVMVHDGFMNEQALTAMTILNTVNTAITRFGATNVTTVGHSLGAALALIDGVFLRLRLPSTITVSVYGFGMPRVGNQAFADYVDSQLPNLVSRVNNRCTSVPIVPPLTGTFGYHHPSGEKHIMDDGSWVACAGQDNTDTRCSTGDVPTIIQGKKADHSGPYAGTGLESIGMGCCDSDIGCI
ncbi:Lipase class 3 family protein [Mycena venus]|uniref:Lipase class 3 family protein n=1 Tax=Mycena venus TaxID=2733690 RepID=A0A8H6XAH7_9AGAR|nr:Lipase class 3 family protein [Mycena venus]